MSQISFSQKTLSFLRDLKRNNSVLRGRPWLEENRSVYETNIRVPLLELCQRVGDRLRHDFPELYVSPKSNVYRLHRDLRFTHDHRPFKEWISFHLWLGKRPDKKTRPGFYFHVESGLLYIGGGRWEFTKDQLANFREKLLVPKIANELKRIVKSLERSGFTAKSQDLKKIPASFLEHSPFPEAYLWKGLAFGYEYSPVPKEFYSEDLDKLVIKHLKKLYPLIHWLDEHVCVGSNQLSQ